MEKEVKLFGFRSSPYVLRVEWAMRMKGFKYVYIEEDLSNKSTELLDYNPVYQKVPVLVHDEKPICESLVILQYIDETWPHCPLLPRDPYEKAMALFWSKFIADTLSPTIWRVLITEGTEQQEAYASATEKLKMLEEHLGSKIFFGGETIGFVDLVLGGLANTTDIYEEITGLTLIDKQRFPSLSAWIENFSSSVFVKDSFPPREKLLPRLRKLREAFLASTGL